MKLAALILLFAIFGKISAVPLRVGYYRAVPQQIEAEESEEEDAEISAEDFSNDKIQDDDDDSDEHEVPPTFNKLFPLPQANSPGHNFPLAVMMSEISAQGWNVPRRPHQIPNEKKRGRDELDIVYDDDDDDDDDDSDEEDEEEDDEVSENDLPDWQKMFPNLNEGGNGPPADVVDTSSAPDLPASFRSGIGGSRVVYIPARQLRQQQMRIRPTTSSVPRQYIMRAPSTPVRSQYVYAPSTSYMNRQPLVVRGRPQQIMASASNRRPQQMVYYMPVRRGSYSPYTSAYVPRYRY